jgi:hypothetical protein
MHFVNFIGVTQVGHHAQEDFGEEVGKSLKSLLKRVSVVYFTALIVSWNELQEKL